MSNILENRKELVIDFSKGSIHTNAKYKQWDTNSGILSMRVVKNGSPISIIGQDITFNFLKPDNTIVTQNSTNGVSITDGINGKFECLLKNQTLAAVGDVNCDITFKMDGKTLSTLTFTFKVEASIGNGDNVSSSNYISSIENILLVMNSAEGIRVSAESNRVVSENTRLTNETDRTTKEGLRVTAETDRVTKEGLRATAETDRVTKEGLRVTAETSRATNEGLRVTNEGIRVTDHQARENSFDSMTQLFDDRVEFRAFVAEPVIINKVSATELLNKINANTSSLANMATEKAPQIALDDTNAIVANNTNRIGIQENKKISQSDVTQEFFGQFVDNTQPLNIVPADDSITQKQLKFPVAKAIPSKNEFDKLAVTPSSLISAENGTLSTLAGYNVSDFMPVYPSSTHTIHNLVFGVALDENKAYISGLMTETFTVPSNCYYVRTNTTDANLDTQQMELGNVKTSYVPFENMVDVATLPTIPSSLIGLNSIDKTKLTFSPLDGIPSINKFNKLATTQNKYVSYLSGSIGDVAGCSISEPIEMLPSTNYHRIDVQQLAFYDDTNAFISGIESTNQFLTPSNCKYMIETILTSNSEVEQLELGTIGTTYESYGLKVPSSSYGANSIDKKALNFVLSVNLNLKNLVIVAKEGGDYATINEALLGVSDTIDNPMTILVMPGVYVETVRLISRYVSLVGINKDTCIIKTFTNDYTQPPIDLGPNSNVCNFTIIADDDGVTTPHPGMGSYAIHADLAGRGIDTDNIINQGIARVKNCILIAINQCPVGIGLTNKEHLIFEDCELYSPNTIVLYAHSFINAGATKQKLLFKNCILHTDVSAQAVCLMDANWYTTGARDCTDTEFTFINNVAWSEVNGQTNALNVVGYESLAVGCPTGYVKLGKGSYGNSITSLNATQ